METKEEIRKLLLSRRLSLGAEERGSLSRVIQERVLVSRLLEGRRTVALYSPIKNEVETNLIFEEIEGRGYRVLYPRVGEAGIEFCEVSRLEDLSPGAWGILEPKGEGKVDISKIDTILLPGVAFDERGYRIGFGKGSYDRALEGFEGLTIGLAYDFQVVRKLSENKGDARCRWVVTEKRVITSEGPRGGIL